MPLLYYLLNGEICAMPKATTTKKHTLRNILLIILAVLILASGITAYVFRDYLSQISRVYNSVTHSSEEISSMKDENDKKTNELLNELVEVTMRDLTDEERAKLAKGELSASDAISLIQGLMPPPDVTADTSAVTSAAGEVVTSTPEETVEEPPVYSETAADIPTDSTTAASTTVATTKAPAPATPESDEALKNRISEIIAEIYLLRATYLNKIDDLIYSAKVEYINLPKEQRGLKGKLQIVDQYLRPKGKELEAECDAKMDALLKEMEGILHKLKMNKSIIDEIKYTYKEQKDIKMMELYGEYSSALK